MSARTGGGLTYLREILPPLADALSESGASLVVLLGREAGTQLAGVLEPSSLTVHVPSWSGRPGLLRLLAEQALLPGLLHRLSADAVFHAGDILPLRSKIPSILLCRNMLLYAPLGKHNARLRALRLLARQSLKRASAVAFVSNTVAEAAVAVCRPRRWSVIHHGPGLAMPPVQHRRPGALGLLIVSSLYDYKRVELAIDAIAELRRRGHPATLEIVGRPIESGYVAELHRRVSRFDLGDAVRFIGEGNAAQVMEAYQRATMAVVTSQNESFCHPILEAFGAGIPVIVPTDLTVAPEIAEDAAVYAEPSGSAIAAVAEQLFLDRQSYDGFVRAGAARLASFSWERAARATADLILSCIR